MTKHVILDTDIWGDPDDVFALLLTLNSPEVCIDLIVTSDEHKGHRGLYTQEFLEKLGYDIPVVEGKDLGNSKYCMVCDHATGINAVTELLHITEVVRKNEKTFIVCIGPQSNLAKFLGYAFRYEPELAQKVEVLMMGGAINYRKKNKAEHNVKLDVEAARKVFAADIKKRVDSLVDNVSRLLTSVDGLAEKVDDIEHAFVSNQAAHDRLEKRPSWLEKHLELEPMFH